MGRGCRQSLRQTSCCRRSPDSRPRPRTSSSTSSSPAELTRSQRVPRPVVFAWNARVLIGHGQLRGAREAREPAVEGAGYVSLPDRVRVRLYVFPELCSRSSVSGFGSEQLLSFPAGGGTSIGNTFRPVRFGSALAAAGPLDSLSSQEPKVVGRAVTSAGRLMIVARVTCSRRAAGDPCSETLSWLFMLKL